MWRLVSKAKGARLRTRAPGHACRGRGPSKRARVSACQPSEGPGVQCVVPHSIQSINPSPRCTLQFDRPAVQPASPLRPGYPHSRAVALGWLQQPLCAATGVSACASLLMPKLAGSFGLKGFMPATASATGKRNTGLAAVCALGSKSCSCCAIRGLADSSNYRWVGQACRLGGSGSRCPRHTLAASATRRRTPRGFLSFMLHTAVIPLCVIQGLWL